MKNIGIVAITAEGASLCYRQIIKESSAILGRNKHPEVFLHNPSFDTILRAQQNKDWGQVADIIINSIQKLASVSAEFIIIPANSVQFANDEIGDKSPIPVLDLVGITAAECKNKKCEKVAVLGVGITMSDQLYTNSLKEHRIELLTPAQEDQNLINQIIYDEIVPAKITQHSIDSIYKVIGKLKSEGADAAVLACTELPIVIHEDRSPLPLIDTTILLAQHAVKYATDRML